MFVIHTAGKNKSLWFRFSPLSEERSPLNIIDKQKLCPLLLSDNAKKSGATPLIIAAQRGHESIVRYASARGPRHLLWKGCLGPKSGFQQESNSTFNGWKHFPCCSTRHLCCLLHPDLLSMGWLTLGSSGSPAMGARLHMCLFRKLFG